MISSPKIKFGVHTFIWKKEFLGNEEYVFQDAKRWGFDGIEIATHYFDQIDPLQLKSYGEKYGVELTFCTSLPDRKSVV